MKNSEDVVIAWGERVGYQSASNSIIMNLERNDREKSKAFVATLIRRVALLASLF